MSVRSVSEVPELLKQAGVERQPESAADDLSRIAIIIDRLLQEANGARRSVMSRETIASLLRLVANGERLAWARSHEADNFAHSLTATVALCARIDPSELCIAIACSPAGEASPGRAWSNLKPWRPATQATADKLKHWLDVNSEDRIRLPVANAASVGSELMKLPAPRIRWRKGVWSGSNEVFVVRIPWSQHDEFED